MAPGTPPCALCGSAVSDPLGCPRDTVNQPCRRVSYTQFILLLRVWAAILGFCFIQCKTKHNRTPSQRGHWLSPVPCIGPGACLASWLWGKRRRRRQERRSTQGCAQSSPSEARAGRPAHTFVGWPQTLELKIRCAFFLRSKTRTSFSPLPKGPGYCQVWDPVSQVLLSPDGFGFMSFAT